MSNLLTSFKQKTSFNIQQRHQKRQSIRISKYKNESNWHIRVHPESERASTSTRTMMKFRHCYRDQDGKLTCSSKMNSQVNEHEKLIWVQQRSFCSRSIQRKNPNEQHWCPLNWLNIVKTNYIAPKFLVKMRALFYVNVESELPTNKRDLKFI